MAGRRLSPDEQAAWDTVARTVRAVRRSAPAPKRVAVEAPARAPVPVARIASPAAAPAPDVTLDPKAAFARWLTTGQPLPVQSAPVPRPTAVLDSSWEKRIRGGRIVPEMTVDLHGHSVAQAHLLLQRTLATAIERGVRVLLVITGRPRKSSENIGIVQRGAIRAEIGHWLAEGAHAAQIASVRTAHPRHGGAGALYLILRRKG
ncbi:MAG: DNA mismatch repair protein MutS [Sphingobium sp.]|nr:MAG: DNA mismatch repair protein MutS [Sphingobium sp.]